MGNPEIISSDFLIPGRGLHSPKHFFTEINCGIVLISGKISGIFFRWVKTNFGLLILSEVPSFGNPDVFPGENDHWLTMNFFLTYKFLESPWGSGNQYPGKKFNALKISLDIFLEINSSRWMQFVLFLVSPFYELYRQLSIIRQIVMEVESEGLSNDI